VPVCKGLSSGVERRFCLRSSNIGGGSVQWDGKYLAVGDQTANDIYRFAISGLTGTLEGTTQLGFTGSGLHIVLDFAITQRGSSSQTVVGGDVPNDQVLYWKYPEGGAPLKIISDKAARPRSTRAGARLPVQAADVLCTARPYGTVRRSGFLTFSNGPVGNGRERAASAGNVATKKPYKITPFGSGRDCPEPPSVGSIPVGATRGLLILYGFFVHLAAVSASILTAV
jgi:hypothetical protein